MSEETIKKEETKQAVPKKKEKKEVHYHYHNEKKRGFGFGRFLFGALVICFGLALLAQNFGLIAFDWSVNFWKFWPLLVIVFGLSLLSGRGWISVLIGILATVFVLAALFLIFSKNISWREQTSDFRETPFGFLKDEGVSRLNLEIEAKAGKISLEEGTPGELVSGTLFSNFAYLESGSETKGGVQNVFLRQQPRNGNFFWGGMNKMDLRVDPELPLDLSINTGASEVNLDLSELLAEETEVKAGASGLNLTLGDKIKTARFKISAGASSVKIRLPENLGAEIHLNSGLSATSLPDFQKIDADLYRSLNFNESKNKAEITLDLGASNLEVFWY